jgi:sugar phosphate isomerase/epimerase
MRGICLDHLTIVDAKPDELVAIAASLGCVAVGMLVRPVPMPRAAAFDLIGDARYQDEIRRRCADSAVSIQLIEPFELTAQTAWDAVRATLETGAALGAKAAGWRAYDPDAARLLQQFGRFSELATEFGLGTVLEFTPRTVIRTLADAESFLRQAGCPRARINFDVLHWIRSGGSQTNVEIGCPQLIGHVQVCDGLSQAVFTDHGLYEAGCQRLAPGEGDFNLRAILTSLPREPLIGVEIPRADLMEAGVSAAERASRAVAATRELLARFS